MRHLAWSAISPFPGLMTYTRNWGAPSGIYNKFRCSPDGNYGVLIWKPPLNDFQPIYAFNGSTRRLESALLKDRERTTWRGQLWCSKKAVCKRAARLYCCIMRIVWMQEEMYRANRNVKWIGEFPCFLRVIFVWGKAIRSHSLYGNIFAI